MFTTVGPATPGPPTWKCALFVPLGMLNTSMFQRHGLRAQVERHRRGAKRAGEDTRSRRFMVARKIAVNRTSLRLGRSQPLRRRTLPQSLRHHTSHH